MMNLTVHRTTRIEIERTVAKGLNGNDHEWLTLEAHDERGGRIEVTVHAGENGKLPRIEGNFADARRKAEAGCDQLRREMHLLEAKLRRALELANVAQETGGISQFELAELDGLNRWLSNREEGQQELQV